MERNASRPCAGERRSSVFERAHPPDVPGLLSVRLVFRDHDISEVVDYEVLARQYHRGRAGFFDDSWTDAGKAGGDASPLMNAHIA
jgi:hypothetical protein